MSYGFIIWNSIYKVLWIPLSMIKTFIYIVSKHIVYHDKIITYMVFIHVNTGDTIFFLIKLILII